MNPLQFPDIDIQKGASVTAEHAAFFLEHGVLLLKNVLEPRELEELRSETAAWIARADELDGHPDYFYKVHDTTGRRVPFRIDFTISKMDSARRLLAHPAILSAVERICGPDFIPTWDSMVFKMPGEGADVPWHRDSGPAVDGLPPVFFADIYLDDSDASNCLHVIPGSQSWPSAAAHARIREMNEGGFRTDGSLAVPVPAGSVLLHNIHVLHGSPAACSALRRVIYFAFRAVALERTVNCSTGDYIEAKRKILGACRALRTGEYAAGDAEPAQWRVPHIEL